MLHRINKGEFFSPLRGKDGIIKDLSSFFLVRFQAQNVPKLMDCSALQTSKIQGRAPEKKLEKRKDKRGGKRKESGKGRERDKEIVYYFFTSGKGGILISRH